MADFTAYEKNWGKSGTPKDLQLLNGGDPAVANSFLLEVDGVEVGIFKEVEGLEFSIATQEIPEGGQNGYVHRAVGRITWTNIILRRGMTVGDALFKWVTETSGSGLAGKSNAIEPKTGAITAIDYTGSRLRSWNFSGAMPVKWSGPKFSVDQRSSLEETIEISHQGFTSKTF